MTPLAVLLAVFIATALADIYTTKRAILDHYHGWKLGVWERNPLVRALWEVVGVNRGNAWEPGSQRKAMAVLVLHKAAFVALACLLHRWSPPVALAWLGVLSAVQAWAALANRKLLHAKRARVDARR